MKTKTQILFHAALLLACVKSHSQTLTCTYNCPKIGEVFSIKTASPVLHTSGQNQLWDFTQMQAVSPSATLIKYVDPNSSVGFTSHPQATILRLESTNERFMKTDSIGIFTVSPSNYTVFGQSATLVFPFIFGSVYSETITSSYQSGSDIIKVTYSKQLKGVGTGTLLLPNGTYTDVIRISGMLNESQTKNGVSDGYSFSTSLNYYYSEKISHPLLYSSYKYGGAADYAPFTQFLSEVPTGISEENADDISEINIAPNPTSDKVFIKTTLNTKGKISLSNVLGQVVISDVYMGSSAFDLSHLPEGIYTLALTQSGKIQTKKIVIAR